MSMFTLYKACQSSSVFWKSGNIGTEQKRSVQIDYIFLSDKNNIPEREVGIEGSHQTGRDRVLLAKHMPLYNPLTVTSSR